MKGEYSLNNEDHHPPSDSTTMFTKLQPPPQFHVTSKEASIEVHRRPRGRPPGSRNKPKPPIFITQESDPPMTPYVLELSPNIDIIETVTRFCCTRAIGLCILSGSGAVADVTLRQPSSNSPASTVTFHGSFDILSISATLLHASNNSDNSCGPINGPCSFTISLAGPQGQVFGGPVVGPLTSAGIIYLIAATFINPCYQRLPLEEESGNNNGGGGGGEEGGRQSPSGVSGGGGDGGHKQVEGLDMFSLPSDVIWAPTARQPQQPYYTIHESNL